MKDPILSRRVLEVVYMVIKLITFGDCKKKELLVGLTEVEIT